MSRRDDPDIFILRVADQLWERYCRVGFMTDMARYYSAASWVSARARKHRELQIYRDYCAYHHLPTGIDERQV